MKSILKRDENSSSCSNRPRSALMQPFTTSESVVQIHARDARLSAVSRSSSSDTPVNVFCRLHHVDEELERDIDADLQHVEDKLDRLERQLDSQFQQYGSRLRSRVVEEPQVGIGCRQQCCTGRKVRPIRKIYGCPKGLRP